MPITQDLQSPTSEMVLLTPNTENPPNIIAATANDHNKRGGSEESNNSRVQMKKQLGLLEGVAIILGIIFGSGIFISPKGVINEVEAVGTSLIIWVLCGLLSMIGALCYAELGTSIPKSGGDYAYILEAYGSLPAFLYLWDAMMIFVPTTNAIMGLTFASYVLQPFYEGSCEIPTAAKQMLAAITICFLTYLNSFYMKVTTKMQNIIMFTKIAALVMIIVIGLVWMFLGHYENFTDAFANTQTDPGKLSVAFYSGIFSYAGWNYLNFMTEELRDPYRNLPRAIYISLPLVTVIYVLANMAYLAVLSAAEMQASDAIAVTFGNKILGTWSLIIPIMVAISAFGGLSVHIMTSSRMCFVGARNGHMPAILSHISVKHFTPLPSLVFLCALSIIMLVCSDVYVLITYSSIVESFFIMLSVSAVLYFRYTRPNMERPIKVSMWIPIAFVIICAFLVVVPIYVAPYEVGMGVLITVIGIPFYYVGVVWKSKPQWLLNLISSLTFTCQKLFMSAKEEKYD
ncbi:Y+L amino acid transporter 2-like [Lucilia sericata]|uniref:Y+L amino acid transporter 2-like n=1 Tax=Lucilia sericata TaxID=13632 RepID=UPI0018A7FBE5|nr:Y+L amino acid transporter 2-like [Lucilia sericata]XP_037825569.1 Y+L amino acid transporter 2-like [Lucilia sericata]XP_037825570.1 Y+L amino acid transporter 2-like [Lucilia sericata]XP_037825571.1 Y+L amino acid transporter 2-like [Lucilia sericata]